MENPDKKNKKGLKDVSHLFLSSLDKKEKSPSPRISVSYFLGVFGGDKECSFFSSLDIAKKLNAQGIRSIVFDFHPSSQQNADNVEKDPSVLTCRKQSFDDEENLPNEWNHLLWLSDLPWGATSALESVIKNIDALILVLKPSWPVLRNVYRLLKPIYPLLKADIFVLWEGEVSAEQTVAVNKWFDYVRGTLALKVFPVETPQQILSELSKREGPSSSVLLNAKRDFPRPLAESSISFEKARLSPEEISSFFDLQYGGSFR